MIVNIIGKIIYLIFVINKKIFGAMKQLSLDSFAKKKKKVLNIDSDE